MACKTSYELHHHFPRLAEESGFIFNTHRPRVHIDWTKIRLIDIDHVIRERKFVIIEQHLNDILDCVFESEFDVRILDEGVLKMFRLAQLAIEYQQFCRHYLDRSVYVLREEISSLVQELDSTKKQIQEKEEELRKLRKRSRHSFKTPLSYGNDNIAAMILKTLSNKGESIFPSSSNTDALQYNKCSYCQKVFLNQLYLQSHITRRHADSTETKDKPREDDNNYLSTEVMQLKNKLQEMEEAFKNVQNNKLPQYPSSPLRVNNTQNAEPSVTVQKQTNIETKDAEVSTNNEKYIEQKLEEWKKEEHEKYKSEINMLRTQILETIKTIKDKETTAEPKENSVAELLQMTIKQQGSEIMALKEALINSKKEKNIEALEKSKESEAQAEFWTKREEMQTKQYEALVLKLNEVAKDAKESRALVERERQRADQLQDLLQKNMKRHNEASQTTTDLIVMQAKQDKIHQVNHTDMADQKSNTASSVNRHSLETLHRKAQELLNKESTTSESSISPRDKIKRTSKRDKTMENTVVKNMKPNTDFKISLLKDKNGIVANDKIDRKPVKANTSKGKTNRSKNIKLNSSTASVTGSPIRVVRAKLTEEVSARLASCGIDPLRSRIPQNIFYKQHLALQHLHEVKTKKNVLYGKARNSILTYLDSQTTTSKETNGLQEYAFPYKQNKSFPSFTSVISNVKSKALSMVKSSNENNIKDETNKMKNNVSRKAISSVQKPSSSLPDNSVDSRSPLKNIDKKMEVAKPTPKRKTAFNKEINSELPKKSNCNFIKEEINDEIESSSVESDHKYYNSKLLLENTKSIENLIKSPARRPASADTQVTQPLKKYALENGNSFNRTQSATDLSESKENLAKSFNKPIHVTNDNNSREDGDSLSDTFVKKTLSDENIINTRQTKGVLKNASSTSSLNKKKVLFDMDAIQMKSVSASPSQSITDRLDGGEKYELGLVNLDADEWDISSIENEPLKNDTKIQVNTRTSPKIAELKHTIESQLARRSETLASGIVGGVDMLSGTVPKAPSFGGSNTSLGSSILDDSEGAPASNHKAFLKPQKLIERDDSELDISEFSIEGITNKNGSF